MKAIHIPTGQEFILTGSCYWRDEEDNLFLAVSYLEGIETKTNHFPVIDGEIIHPDYELIND